MWVERLRFVVVVYPSPPDDHTRQINSLFNLLVFFQVYLIDDINDIYAINEYSMEIDG